MNPRTPRAIGTAILLALVWPLLGGNLACDLLEPMVPTVPTTQPPTLLESPVYEGRMQAFSTSAEKPPGVPLPEFSDADVVTAGAANPLILSQPVSPPSPVELSLSWDADTFTVDCWHPHDAGGGLETLCAGLLRAGFPIAERRGDALFNVDLIVNNPSGDDFSSQVQSRVEIECGGTTMAADLAASDGLLQAPLEVPVVAGAATCNVAVSLVEARLRTLLVAASLSALHSVRVTALQVAPVECSDHSQCPPDAFCGAATGVCGDGGTAHSCVVASVDCAETHPVCVDLGFDAGCSGGWAAPCFFAGQCAEGYECEANWCVGPVVCVTDADCAADENCLSGGSCAPKPEGEPGMGCHEARACKGADSSGSGICQFHVCMKVVGPGESCASPSALCPEGLVCDPVTSTCL